MNHNPVRLFRDILVDAPQSVSGELPDHSLLNSEAISAINKGIDQAYNLGLQHAALMISRTNDTYLMMSGLDEAVLISKIESLKKKVGTPIEPIPDKTS